MNTQLGKQKTSYGNITYRRRSGYKKQTIYFDITYKNLPNGIKRFRGSCHTADLDRAKKETPIVVEHEYEKRKGEGVARRYTPINSYLINYFKWCEDQVRVGSLVKDMRGRKIKWTHNKALHDKRSLNKFFLPFVEANQLTWRDLQLDETIERLVQRMRREIADSTIRRHKGALSTMLRKAMKDGLIDRLPNFPTLDAETNVMKDSYAIATTAMLDNLFDVIEDKQKASTHLRDRWAYELLDCWVRLLMDTGMRPTAKRPIRYFSTQHWTPRFSKNRDNGDVKYTAERITIFRHDKISNKYWSEGSDATRAVIDRLMNLYREHRLDTLYLFSNRDGSPNTSLNKLFYQVSKLAGWKDMFDSHGRKYTTYSIRKWHINESIKAGDSPHDVAIRCGHAYETLKKFYLDPTRQGMALKAEIWKRRKEKVA